MPNRCNEHGHYYSDVDPTDPLCDCGQTSRADFADMKAHEESDKCWCEPTIAYLEDGVAVLVHREVH